MPPATPWTFWLGLALGAPVAGYGVWWLLHNARLTMPRGWATTLVAAAVGHDLVLVPLVLLVGAVVSRIVPRWLAAPVLVGLALSAIITLYAIPVVAGYGRRPSNPTLLVRDYDQALLLVLAVVWVVTGTAAAVRWHRHVRRSEPPRPQATQDRS